MRPPRSRRLIWLASSALGFAVLPAAAQDATWLGSPGSSDYSTNANWSGGLVPTGTAFFGTSDTTSLFFSPTFTDVNGWTFNAGASAYSFTIAGNLALRFYGAGIIVDGGSAVLTNTGYLHFYGASTAGGASVINNANQYFMDASTAGSGSFTNNSNTNFNDTSTAGSATITNSGSLQFNNSSSAASAVITNIGNVIFSGSSTAANAAITTSGLGGLYFGDTSTAGNAVITNLATLNFYGSGSAGNASITTSSLLQFLNTSTAANAAITNTSNLQFKDTATAASATITNSGTLAFSVNSSAGNASITTNSAGRTFFVDTSSGGTARLIAGLGGVVDFSPLTSGGTTAGSFEGGGRFNLGSKTLTVGGNDLSTTVSGVIADGGFSGGTGAALVKTGTGTLTLSGTNTYSGGTTINNGVLQLGDGSGTGKIVNAVVNSATFEVVKADTSGITSIANNGLARFRNSTSAGTATVTNTGTLDFYGTSTAGSANIDNSNLMNFRDTSTAGSASITSTGGIVSFFETGSAGHAIINASAGGVSFLDSSTAAGATITNTGTASLYFGGTSAAGSAIITLGSSTTTTFAEASTAGSAHITSSGNLNFFDTSTAGGATIGSNAGRLGFYASSSAGTATITSSGLGSIAFYNSATAGSAFITNNTTLTFNQTATAGSATIANNAALAFIDNSTAGNAAIANGAAGSTDFSQSTGLLGNNRLSAGSLAGGGTFRLGNNELTVGGNNLSTTVSGVIADGGLGGGTAGSLVKTGTGTMTLNGINSYSGGTFVNAGTLQIAGAGSLGASGGKTAVAGGTLDLGGTTQTQNGGVVLNSGAIVNGTLASSADFDLQNGTLNAALAGSGGLTKSGSGRVDLAEINTYSGATAVNGGTLSINGSILNSAVTVNAGGTLGGNGTVGNTIFNGGTLSPGNSIGQLTVQGNLALSSAATYMVEVSTTGSDRTNVTGTANLGGAKVSASFASGKYVAKQYTILHAAGGLGGSTFNTLVNSDLPSGVKTSLRYDTSNVYLDLELIFIAPPNTGLSGNQSGAGQALVNYFDRNGGIPLVYGGLTAAGLTQVAGETATGSQQTTFNAMTQFMGMMTDPFSAGRGFDAPGAMGYADARKPHDAFAMFTKAPPMAPSFEARWSVWASGFGGSQTTDGNAATGSNTSNSSIGGTAVGADVLLSPTTVAGFAMAGGGTSFSVTGGGSGRSDLFQIGGFARHSIGSTYLSGALAYGWQDVTTNRSVMTDQLQARFSPNTFSGRFEVGNRTVTSWQGGLGLTPYAAVQFTAVMLPAYAETAVAGSNAFALSYTSKTVNDTRSELGLRTDKSYAVGDALLTLRGRAAWAHDFNTDRAASATFMSLPGASFVVNGAAAAHDAALTTASAEMSFISGISLAATFEGEFSDVTRSYAGKGVVRYTW
ncbi:hypothetical protein A4A58_17915 [Tardiphaga robiniae]|uniref:Autotransporter domain-containing protein n=2 Tax=Tardiphaga robiniae TaxID=943830 RepID=A0A163X9S4_9BRAD|nr:hypothetical protein A4A58_17915 [Tardiphaga robiniae]